MTTMNLGPTTSFTGDPELDAEFESLVRENELMLIEISELKSKSAKGEKERRILEDRNAQLQQELDSLREFCRDRDTRDEGEHDYNELLEKHEELIASYQELQQLLDDEVDKNRQAPVPASSDDSKRLERVLRDLRGFATSTKSMGAYLRRIGVSTAIPKDRLAFECEKNQDTSKKLVDSLKRLVTVVSDDDEVLATVKNLVGEIATAGCSSLQDTLATITSLLGGAAAANGAAAGGAAEANAKQMSFWRGK